jgi:Xaa-Pro aminopeptidase
MNTPKVELEQRIFNFQKYLKKENIDGALILQRVDLFYFTGTIQQAHFYIPAEGDPVLMVRKSYERAKAESSVEKIVHLDRPSDIPGILKANGHALPATLGLERDVLPTNIFFSFQGIFENPQIVAISHAIRLIRAVKSPYEIDIMQRAAPASDDRHGACL